MTSPGNMAIENDTRVFNALAAAFASYGRYNDALTLLSLSQKLGGNVNAINEIRCCIWFKLGAYQDVVDFLMTADNLSTSLSGLLERSKVLARK